MTEIRRGGTQYGCGQMKMGEAFSNGKEVNHVEDRGSLDGFSGGRREAKTRRRRLFLQSGLYTLQSLTYLVADDEGHN